jgi:hypothetical protein
VTVPASISSATQMAEFYPNIAALVGEISGGDNLARRGLGRRRGCGDQFEFEFEFALDLILDGLERLRASA